jgi:hypothetical protein
MIGGFDNALSGFPGIPLGTTLTAFRFLEISTSGVPAHASTEANIKGVIDASGRFGIARISRAPLKGVVNLNNLASVSVGTPLYFASSGRLGVGVSGGIVAYAMEAKTNLTGVAADFVINILWV